MKSVRRLYIYAVALISIEVVLWGLINLLRSIASQTVGGTAEVLARALALTVVGLPIFLFHWLWAQRLAASDEEERTASLRAIFFYGMLLATLIPLVQNLLALVNRGLLMAAGLETGRAILGATGIAVDNLIAIAINGLVALYFWSVLRAEWPALPDRENFADVRRLYRYLWILYGLLMTIFGAQQILRYIFFVPTGLLGEMTRATIVNGLALLLIGTPIWVYAWNVVQGSLADENERDSNLRLAVLYLLGLSGVITVLTTAAMVLHTLVDALLGTAIPVSDLVNRIGGPLSIGVPLGAVWAYYGHWLGRHIDSVAEPVRRAGMKRIYLYILSAVGLGGALIGVAMLNQFIIERFTGGLLVLEAALRTDLARAIGVIAAWLPLWLVTWRRLQGEAAAAGDAGDHARRSIVRRAYLYLALFAGVIGGMIFAAALVFELINTALTGRSGSTLLSTILNDLQLLVLFGVLLAYHLGVMRRDGRSSAAALAGKQKAFKLLVVDSAGGFGQAVRAALGRVAPNVPVTVTARQPRGRFDAMIVSGSRLLDAPQWVRLFRGARIVVPDEAGGLHWAGGIDADPIHKAALTARQLAEGQEVSRHARRSGWTVIVYIAAALFGLQMILMLLVLVISSFMD
ncbi:MAG: DUF5671 domain-containing protein [Chloroflexota bacterium]